MNIFHLVSNKAWGGGEQYVFDLARNQSQEERNYVEIVCRNQHSIFTKFKELEIPISTLPLKGFTDLDSAIRFSRLIKKGENIIHVHNFKDAFTACVARKISENECVKVVLTRHLVKKGKDSLLYKKLYKSIDKIVFVSEIARDEFLKGNPSINAEKLQVIHNSILPQPVTKSESLREKFNIPQNQSIIMFHGRVVREKGVDILLKGLSQIDRSKYHLVIVGAGDATYREHLQQIIVANKLDANVSFTGYVANTQSIISQCDFGVLPSVARESLGLSNLEYMMMGKAQICSNNGAQPEYLKNDFSAILVSPENPFSLAEAINLLLDNPQKRLEMGKNAKEEFDNNLSYPHFYSQIKSVYQNL